MVQRLFAIALFVLCGVSGNAARAEFVPSLPNFIEASPPAPLPAFVFEDSQRQTQTINRFHGRFVLLNLWATWCGPCVAEMPSLDALQRVFDARKLVVVALNEDRDGHSAAAMFFKRYNMRSLELYVDTGGRVPSLLKAQGLPTTLLIDPQGREIGRISGEVVWDAPATIAFLKAKMAAAMPVEKAQEYSEQKKCRAIQ